MYSLVNIKNCAFTCHVLQACTGEGPPKAAGEPVCGAAGSVHHLPGRRPPHTQHRGLHRHRCRLTLDPHWLITLLHFIFVHSIAVSSSSFFIKEFLKHLITFLNLRTLSCSYGEILRKRRDVQLLQTVIQIPQSDYDIVYHEI